MDPPDNSDLTVSLTKHIEPQIAVYFEMPPTPLSLEELMAVASAWIDRNVDPRLAPTLQRMRDSGAYALTAGPIVDVQPIREAMHAAPSVGDEEMRRLKRANAGVLVHTRGLPGGFWQPIWLALAASRAYVEHFEGVAWDLLATRVLPIAANTTPIVASATLVPTDHVRLVWRSNAQASELHTAGARKLGLPELCIGRVRNDLERDVFERAVLATLEQLVSELWHGMRENPRPARLPLSNAIDLGFELGLVEATSLLLVVQKVVDGEPVLVEALPPPPATWDEWHDRASGVLRARV